PSEAGRRGSRDRRRRLPRLSMKPFACSFHSRTRTVCSLYGQSQARSKKVSQGTEIEVEVAVLEAEVVLQLLHPPLELHEGLPHSLDLVVGERALLHPSEGLEFHQLAKKLDQRQHELRKPSLHLLRVGVDPARERTRHVIELARDSPEVAAAGEDLVDRLVASAHASSRASANEYGGHGPGQTMVSSGCSRSSPATRSRNSGVRSPGTRDE